MCDQGDGSCRVGHWSPVVNTLPEPLLGRGIGGPGPRGAHCTPMGEVSCPRLAVGPHQRVLRRGGVISAGFL